VSNVASQVRDLGGWLVHRRLIAGLVVILLWAPARAADLEMPAPVQSGAAHAVPAPAQQTAGANWTGGQFGGANGVSSVNNNFVEPGAYVCPTGFAFNVSCFETPFSFSRHSLSYTIGPFLGYRWQVGNAVIGVETDWSWQRGASTLAQSLPFVCFDLGCADYRSDRLSGSVKQNWNSSLRLRYGWLVTPSTLLYGTAGVAIGQIGGSFSYNGQVYEACAGGLAACPPTPGVSAAAIASWSDIRVGGTVGAGLEVAINGPWKARIEYRFTDFGHYTKSVPLVSACPANGCDTPSSAATIALRESFQTVRFGLGYDF
jgi:outer membrane immunogenic protein